MADDAEIGRLMREKKDLETKIRARSGDLSDQGSLLASIGATLRSYPETLSFERRDIELQFTRRGYLPVDLSKMITADKLIEEVEALRADKTALNAVEGKLRQGGY